MNNGNPGVVVREATGTWLLHAWVQPGAKRTAVVGVMDGCLKIRVAAPAVDNKANAALLAYLAQVLGLRRGQMEIAGGMHGRRKKICIVAEEEPDWEKLIPSGME